MIHDILVPALFAFALAGNPAANTCQKFFVSAPDGYVNVRSAPEVKTGNIVATLPTGSSIEFSQRRQKWLKIKAPLSGWLAGAQVSRISCDSGHDLLMKTGLPAIDTLGKKSELGDAKAAETLVKMSPYTDGVVEEAYAGTIARWANKNPKFLVSTLDRQTPSLRRSVLSSLDFGLGVADSPERQKFETFLQELSPRNLTLQDWRNRNPLYPSPDRS